jgi:hypothetical protein
MLLLNFWVNSNMFGHKHVVTNLLITFLNGSFYQKNDLKNLA